jgi:hypothetical protein
MCQFVTETFKLGPDVNTLDNWSNSPRIVQMPQKKKPTLSAPLPTKASFFQPKREYFKTKIFSNSFKSLKRKKEMHFSWPKQKQS